MSISTATATSMASMPMSTAMTNMAFNTNNLITTILSSSWMPTTTGQYAGAWIFIFILAIIWRALVFVQHRLEEHWIKKYSSPAHMDMLRQIPHNQHSSTAQAWRLSVNLPRAVLAYVIQSVAYLLYVPSLSTHALLDQHSKGPLLIVNFVPSIV